MENDPVPQQKRSSVLLLFLELRWNLISFRSYGGILIFPVPGRPSSHTPPWPCDGSLGCFGNDERILLQTQKKAHASSHATYTGVFQGAPSCVAVESVIEGR